MRHFTYLVALMLLCIQNESLGVPIDTTEKGTRQLIYSYKAYTETVSNNNDTIGRWSIEGYLTIQVADKFTIFQLSNLKTSLYNGDRENITQSTFEDIPKDAEILQQPIVLNPKTFTLYVAENEPLWSVNFKRSIASNAQDIEYGKHNEKSVFGNCQTNTEWTDNGRIIKTINHESCKRVSYQNKTNVLPAPGSEQYSPIKIETTIEIITNDPNPNSYHVSSSISYQPIPNDPFTQFSFQKQEMDFINKTTDFEPINTKSLTEEKKIFFEYGDNTSHEIDVKILTQQYLDSFDKFERKIKERPSENHKSTDDPIPIEKMYEALYNASWARSALLPISKPLVLYCLSI